MDMFNSPRKYALVTGIILFIVGLYNYAFRSNVRIPDYYLIASIILGFWGILVSFSRRK